MRKQHRAAVVFVAGILVLLTGGPAGAVLRQYVEDFTTTTYRDTSTTARWDTLAGELGLFPYEPSIVGSLPSLGSSEDVVLDGDFAYIADGAGGLLVVDISDPSTPALLGSSSTSGTAGGVAVAGNTVYVADSYSGLVAIDVTNPAAPTPLGSVGLPGDAVDVVTAGDVAFVAAGSGGLQLVDIADPSSPFVIAGLDTIGVVEGVAVAGNRAYVAAGVAGLLVINITNPATPSVLGGCAAAGVAGDVVVAGNRCYIAAGGAGLHIIDVADPTDPSVLGTCVTLGSASGVTVDGWKAYVACQGAGLCVVDVGDPGSPQTLQSIDTPGSAHGVAVAGEHAFVADGTGGLRVVEVRAALPPPQMMGWCSSPAYGMDVEIDGDLAFSVSSQSYDGWLTITDFSNPREPVVIGTGDVDRRALDVAVSGDYAYIAATYVSHPQILDVSDPTMPFVVAVFDTIGSTGGVAVDGDLAFFGAFSSGFYVVDVSDPTDPELLGWCDTPGSAGEVVPAGDQVFVADGNEGLCVIDVSDPTSPAVIGTCDTPGDLTDVTITGDHAYAADYPDSLIVIDISDPTSPVIVGQEYIARYVSDVTTCGDLAYVTCSYSSYGYVYPVDISDPTNPERLTRVIAEGRVGAIAISGDFAVTGGERIETAWIRQGEYVVEDNVAQSTVFESAEHEVSFFRLSSTQADSIAWAISLDAGERWRGARPDNEWVEYYYSGTELLWRSTHYYCGEGVEPVCTDLAIEWAYEIPTIDAIDDIQGDQGQQVSLTWTKSGYDYVGSSDPITSYAVFRRIDELRDDQRTHNQGPSEQRAQEHRVAAPGGGSDDPERYPPGDWHYLLSVPARCDNEYSVVVPTLVDWDVETGTGYSVFFVRAATGDPSVYYDSPPDSGYSVDNIPPATPTGLDLEYNATQNLLSWDESPDEDFQHFRIYRADTLDFTPSPGNLHHVTIDTSWVDNVTEAWTYYYKMTAVDFAGNESDAASPETVTHGDRDFGDAPDPPYPTLDASGGAFHYVCTGVYLGGGVDAEPDGQPDSLALGDDNDGYDDDDGVTVLTLLVPGMEAEIEVVASVFGHVNVWLDTNQDGWFDLVVPDAPISAGANTLSFHVDGSALPGETFMRARFTTLAGFSQPNGPAPDGEVEDYRVIVGDDRDYGDAPDPPYPTLDASGGAFHYVWSGVYLGGGVDAEPDGQPDSLALGDDNDGNDDDDGITFPAQMYFGRTAEIVVASSSGGHLSMWLDGNGDGDWNDSGEFLVQAEPVIAGYDTLSVPIPAGFTAEETFARFRLSSEPIYVPTGMASDGEVEDYLVTLEPDTCVTWTPEEPEAGGTLTVYYDLDCRGVLAPGTSPVYIHVGHSGWQDLISPDPAMTWDAGEEAWRYTYAIPGPAASVEFVFNDGAGAWDNNSGADWSVPVTGGSTGAIYEMDGALDAEASLVGSGAQLDLYVDFDGTWLYVATQGVGATSGLDHFILVGENPSGSQGAPWAKAGTVAGWDYFLGNEGDNNWSGWFNSGEVLMTSASVISASVAYLEGALDLDTLYGSVPDSILVAVGGYGTADGAALSDQAPAGNGNGDIERAEYYVLDLPQTGVPEEPDAVSGSPRVDVFPNPVIGGTSIRLSLPTGGNVSLSVYDVRGRLVTKLVSEALPDGVHHVRWDGLDGQGRALPSGIYFLRLNACGEHFERKVVLFR